MIRTLALSSAAGLAGLTFVAPLGAPPSSEPQPATETTVEELAGNVEFERNLAELAFALFLGNELNVNAGAYSCTEPSTLVVGEIITCFSLTGADRVVVAITELTGTSGVYTFDVISDFVIAADDSPSPIGSEPDSSPPDSSSVGETTTTLPTPFIVTTSTPLTEADQELIGFAEQINEDADELVQTLVSGNDGVVESAEYSWDSPTATVKLSATLSPTYTSGVDTAAWIIARDRAMALWNRQSPFRAEGTTIRPSLEVTIDDERFLSDFDLTVQLADQTIAMTDWLAESRTS